MQFAPAPSQSRSQEYDFARGLADEKVDVVKLPEHAWTLLKKCPDPVRARPNGVLTFAMPVHPSASVPRQHYLIGKPAGVPQRIAAAKIV